MQLIKLIPSQRTAALTIVPSFSRTSIGSSIMAIAPLGRLTAAEEPPIRYNSEIPETNLAANKMCTRVSIAVTSPIIILAPILRSFEVIFDYNASDIKTSTNHSINFLITKRQFIFISEVNACLYSLTA